MLKRIFTIGLITGSGQLFVVFALKYISQNSSPEQVKAIGQIDSLVLFIMNVIALGLQPSAMRNLALADDWKSEYTNTQSARFTLSFFITAFALLAFIDQYYLVFLIAPLLALSGDYALYGRGYPIKGSVIALVRAIVPFSMVFILMRSGVQFSLLYFIGLLLAYVFTNLFISLFLKSSLIPRLNFAALKMYVTSISLGLVSLSLYFIGIGIILIAQYFYSSPVLATAFVGLKFYIIYKGILRILHQAFFKEMINEEVCLKIDQLSTIAGIVFLGSIIFFPRSFILFFFGEQYLDQHSFFIFIGVAGLIYTLFLSMATRSLLLKKDNVYTIITAVAAIITIVLTILFAFIFKTASGIAISILIGELVWMCGLIKIAGTIDAIWQRMNFLLQCLVVLLLPLGMRYLIGDHLWVYIFSFALFSVIQLFLHSRKLRTMLQEES